MVERVAAGMSTTYIITSRFISAKNSVIIKAVLATAMNSRRIPLHGWDMANVRYGRSLLTNLGLSI